MVDDDRRPRERVGEVGGGVEMPPRRLQVVREPVTLEQRVAAPPARIVHRARGPAPGAEGRRGGGWLLANATDEVEARVPGQDLLDARVLEPGVADRARGQAVRGP